MFLGSNQTDGLSTLMTFILTRKEQDKVNKPKFLHQDLQSDLLVTAHLATTIQHAAPSTLY